MGFNPKYKLILTDGDMGGGEQDVDTLVSTLRKEGNNIPIIVETGNVEKWRTILSGYTTIEFVSKSENLKCKEEISKHLN